MKDSNKIKLIVFSDTHGVSYGMQEVIAMHPDADCYLHLGDGAPDFEMLCTSMGLPHNAVCGNCDFGSDLPVERLISFGEFQFFMTHGHTYQAKFSTLPLRQRGQELGADVILFGHTHTPLLDYYSDEPKSYYLVNPGALSGVGATFALIEIRGKNILISHGRLS